MTLLENIYTQLKTTQLVPNAQTFSTQYLAKNKNWYSYQTHKGRDITLSAAVQCVRTLRIILSAGETLTDVQSSAVAAALQKIQQHLADRYMVTGLAGVTEH
jgi:hypothetical protein